MKEFADFKVISLLGQGQFGETFVAERGGRRMALKIIKEEAVLFGFDTKRFQREVRALQKAVGPNVVQFIEAGSAPVGRENRYYVAMEYLDGQDLAHVFSSRNNSFEEKELINILLQIISGLQTIHGQNIVHRDLKPANILIGDDGVVKLLDFGLVKMLDYTTLTTMPGQPIGTPLYIAPEILRGEAIDYRADFYSLGVLIFHLVTKGNYPITARAPIELYMKVVNEPPNPPTNFNDKLSPEFVNIILTLLAKQPFERAFSHQELIDAIRSTPISIIHQSKIIAGPSRKEHRKTCYFRLLHNEKGEIEQFAREGGKMDGFVYPANFLPRYRNSLESLRNLGISYLFDPVTYRLAYSSFALTQGLVNLPYVPDKNNVLTPDDLRTLTPLQKYAQGVLDWQIQWQCSILVAPFHFSRDLGSPWIDIDIKLIEESKTYAAGRGWKHPVYAGLSLNIEHYTVKSNRMALLNRYARGRADGYIFYVDSFDERTNNPLQIRAYLDLLSLFQNLGKPVIACRVGTLGLGLLSAGIDGMTSGIASLSGFSESDLLQNRTTGYNMTRKYYIPSMMLTLPVEMAQDILSDRRNAHLRCNCPHCHGASSGFDRIAKAHFLRVRTEEIAVINGINTTKDRLTWFSGRIDTAIHNCEQVHRQQVVNLGPGYYAHIKAWKQVFGP